MNPFLGDKFSVGRKLGAGSFGEVRMGKNIETGQQVAIKLESMRTRTPQLLLEYRIYELIAGGEGIPGVHWYGVHGRYNVMVMDLLGASLEDAYQADMTAFNVKKVCEVGRQMVTRVQYVHEKNFLHRDIKPDNFGFGLGRDANTVFILDFGLSKKFKSSRTGQHIAFRDGKSLTGTARYASINSHKGLEQSRRDDLESVGYVLMYFLRQTLPWQGLKVRDDEDKFEKIMEVKIATPVQDLCKGFPDEFAKYITYCKGLQFEERPDYEYLRGLLQTAESSAK
eukprot:GEMP01014128.1.p1 GENE.GEMP01014128.1~~GEMP01014128.1.p1  ORF type:complete len:282 (+),score=26.70 GEMP01014128.1:372-1217(+)